MSIAPSWRAPSIYAQIHDALEIQELSAHSTYGNAEVQPFPRQDVPLHPAARSRLIFEPSEIMLSHGERQEMRLIHSAPKQDSKPDTEGYGLQRWAAERRPVQSSCRKCRGGRERGYQAPNLNEFLHLRMRQYAPFQSPAWIQKLPNAIALP